MSHFREFVRKTETKMCVLRTNPLRTPSPVFPFSGNAHKGSETVCMCEAEKLLLMLIHCM